MKKLIRISLHKILGRRRFRLLLGALRRRRATFFESELIHDYFDGRFGGMMVDVGAHFGESFSDYLDTGWMVLAFEPDPKNRAHLSRFMHMPKFVVREEAVSDQELENVAFFASDESSGISSLSAFRPTHKQIHQVRVTTLRKALSKEGIKSVDFLKIDTEGYDLFVLKGFPWDQQKPEVILCEFEDSKTLPLGYDYRALGDYLRAQNYTVFLSEWFPIVQYGVDHRWRRWVEYPATVEDSNSWGNFVAFRAGVDLSRIEPYLADQRSH
jgi:FkbM family methyltransferase